ncbi:septum formation family protein [Leucobacter massiliensis]|uniref:septum formation family protein n=1 Tax=Leucobacter massiliensis TaxID=1686285 RepID=UPI0015E2993F|nr:septum formation family protein [Leucobacter massiliensis]
MSAPASRLLLAPALAAAAALALSGCSMLNGLTGGSAPERDAESGEVVERNDAADVFEIKPGDCLLTEEGSFETASVPVVPCDEPHDDEVYHAFELPDGEFPGEAAIQERFAEVCPAEFESFAGIAYADSALEIWPFTPTEGSWAAGDREVLCVVYDPAAQTTGSLRGAAR